MQGQIEQAQKSKSGKNLQVKVAGQWYTSKNWELEGMVGTAITFQPTPQQFPDGGSINWLNDYVVVGASSTPADQAFDAALAQNQPPPMGQPAPPQMAPQAPQQPQASKMNREASIVAQALTKAVTCANAQQAWEIYVFLYNKVLEWNPGDFDDNVPF